MNNYIVLTDWMFEMKEEFELDDSELIIFALIYGFSQDKSSRFYGGIAYIREFLKVKKTTAYRKLSKLKNLGLIIEDQQGYSTKNKIPKMGKIKSQNGKIKSQNGKIKSQNGKIKSQNGNPHPYNTKLNNKLNNKESVARARTHEENTHSIYSNDLFSKDLKDVILEFLSNLKEPINDHQFNAITNLIENAVEYIGFDGTIGWINQHIVENRQSLYPDRLPNFVKKSQLGVKKVKNEPDWLQKYLDSF